MIMIEKRYIIHKKTCVVLFRNIKLNKNELRSNFAENTSKLRLEPRS